MRSLGVDVRLKPAARGLPTARSHVLISSDGQRTMCTYLGACTELGIADITATAFGSPKAVLLEGYVWDLPEGPDLALEAMDLARTQGSAVVLSLSDSFCVQRHHAAFSSAVQSQVDIVVADEDEINELMGETEFSATLEAVRQIDCLFVMTRSEKGSVIVRGEETAEQPATPVERVVDSTGAGDAYCAGFLFGWACGKSLSESAKLGTFCATRVIQQLGARIEPGLLEEFD